MKRLGRLLLLNAIPAVLSCAYPLGAGAEVLACLAMIVMVFVNVMTVEKLWVSVVVMLGSAALCVCGSRFTTAMYYYHISGDPVTPPVGDLMSNIVAVTGAACVAVFVIAALVRRVWRG